jgi:hypothetical protein
VVVRAFFLTDNQIRAYLKNNLSAHGGVVERFKMLIYYVYAPLFHRSTPCHEP